MSGTRFFSRPFLFGSAFFLSCALMGKALDWKTTTISIIAAPFQAEQDVVFEFTNHSTKPVTIRELETSCSCLVANSDLKIYPPGAAGKITAKFTLGDRGGLYERNVTVVTDEKDNPTRLTLQVEVPDVASVTPRSVEWRINDEVTEKIVELKTAADLEIIFSNAQPTSDAYVVKMEIVEAGKFYRIHIKPTSTAVPVSAAIRLFGREKKSGHEVVISTYATVH